MVAAWNIDKKDAGSNLLSVLLFFTLFQIWRLLVLILSYIKLYNSVITIKKKNHPSPLLQLSQRKSIVIYTLFNKFNLQKYYHPIPLSLPFICALSMPQPRKKGLHKQRLPVFVGLSLLISICSEYTWLMREPRRVRVRQPVDRQRSLSNNFKKFVKTPKQLINILQNKITIMTERLKSE